MATPASHLPTSPPLISGAAAVAACAAMALSYVAILYAPTLVLRLPPPASIRAFLLRRFACAAVSSAASLLAAASLLRVWRLRNLPSMLAVFGIRSGHLLEAVLLPLLLTSLVYAGTFVSRLWRPASSCSWDGDGGEGSCGLGQKLLHWICTRVTDVLAWRTYVVDLIGIEHQLPLWKLNILASKAPFTEEVVFRACMIPLLLCGGFKPYEVIFLSPIFFSLAHLNHFLELYFQQGYNFVKAFLIVGLQLGYTVIFGWYAAFLFIRTGNIWSPIAAHILCNLMGLPVLSSSRTRGVASIAFVAGSVAFFWLLFPATSPSIYNPRVDHCSCWHGYCRWS